MLPSLQRELNEIENPEAFFLALGGLHDSMLRLLQWRPETRCLGLGIDDLYSNFFQLPEYPGALEARLIASELLDLRIDLKALCTPTSRILGFYVTRQKNTDLINAAIHFGEGKIEFVCRKLQGLAV